MYRKNLTFTTTKNWERYCHTGENRFLDDAASLGAFPKGTRIVIAGEGWEREAILGYL
jgi:hypothetical protein